MDDAQFITDTRKTGHNIGPLDFQSGDLTIITYYRVISDKEHHFQFEIHENNMVRS